MRQYPRSALARALCLLAALTLGRAAAGEDPATIEALMATLGQVQRVQAAYTETLESGLLATAISSPGQLEYVAPDRIVKTGAAGEGVEIHGDTIRVIQGGAVQELAIRDYAPLEALVVALRATFAGDLERLRRDFTLDFGTGDGRWTLLLRPRERTLAAVFERMEISGRGAEITAIEIAEAGGDRRRMQLETRSLQRRAAGP